LQNGSQRLDAQWLGERSWQQRALDRLAFAVMRTVLFLTGHRY
jgi:cardiolipin synthase